MALGKQEDINEDVTGVIEAQELSLGIVHATGHVCILLAVGDFKVGTKAAPDTAREIAAALVKLADEVEAESASEATGKAGL